MAEFQGLLILMVVVWVAGKIFRYLSLPVIFGELIGGIIVGPLLFNAISPDSEVIHVLAELGIFFLMLHSGLENDLQPLLKSSKKSIFIALGDITITFLGGFFVSRLFGLDLHSSLFMALGISATAIAISVRIFKDYRLQNTRIANTVLGAAIVSDILILILFSLILNLIESGSLDIMQIVFQLLKVGLFFGGTIFAGFALRPYLHKMFKDKGFTLTLIIALAFGFIAEQIGLHMIIGAFLAGLFITEEVMDDKIYNKIEDRIYGLSYSFLAPVFFASLAFHLDFTAFTAQPLFLTALLLTAFCGKLFGSGLSAKIQKFTNRDSLIIGLAMNSRGAVDLIIASVGLQLGIINQAQFSILVLVTFAATLLAIFGIRPFRKYIKSSSQEKAASSKILVHES